MPDIVNLPTYIQRYLNGESIQVIAKDLGIHRATLYRHMLRDLGGSEYEDTVTDMLITRIANADEMLENASDMRDITRAREIARFARHDYERRRPNLYGVRPTTAVSINGDGLQVQLVTYGDAKSIDANGITDASDTIDGDDGTVGDDRGP